MNNAPPPDLSPELAELLATERQRPGLSPTAADRILARLENTLSTPPPPPSRRRLISLGSFVLGLIVGGTLVGGFLRTQPGPLQPKLLVLDAPLPPPSTVIVVERQSPAPAVVLPSRGPTVRHGSGHSDRRSAEQSEATSAPERDTELARERALIETARTALSRKQSTAIDVLLRHEQQYPSGRLAEERESLLVQALLHSGRNDEARKRALRFRARWPHSLLLPVIDAALRTIP